MAKVGGSGPDTGQPAWGTDKDAEANDADEDMKLMDRDEPDSCWSKFTSCIGGVWATRQLTSKKDREGYIRTTIRELVVYIIFLVDVCILSLGMSSSDQYYFTRVMTDLFVEGQYPDTKNTFSGSTQVMDVWRFSENILLDGLYWEHWYDTEANSNTRTSRYDYKGTKTNESNILYENRLLGLPRMRQVKVTNDSCIVHKDFREVIRECYHIYSTTAEDTKPYGPNNNTWRYYTEKELDGRSTWGKISTYSGGGYFKDLSRDRKKTSEKIAFLKDNLWITRGTRAVFYDFSVYNANINLFCIVHLIFEFPATGGLVPSWTFRSVKLLRYVEPFDYFVLACEILFTVFIVYYIIEEILEVKAIGSKYFFSFWNILDILVIVMSLGCIAFSVFRYVEVKKKLDELLANPNRYANFEFLGYAEMMYINAVAVMTFFSWIKLFKYISFNKTMTQLNSTLSRCAKDIAGFAVMFFIVFFSFAQLGYLLFGTQVHDYSSFTRAVFTLLRIILGDFNFHEIEQANRVLGPIYFLTYVFFVFFVLLNMFLAIINDTYSEVKAEIAMQRNEFEIADYFKKGYNNMMGKLGHRNEIIDVLNALKLTANDNDGSVEYEALRTNLKKCNFSDMEIEIFFAKYDLEGDRVLSEQETRIVMAELEGDKLELEREIEAQQIMMGERPPTARARTSAMGLGNINDEEFEDVQRRVDKMESSVNSIGSKIDVVLQKLDVMEKAKHKRRETMSKILDSIADSDSVDEATKRKQMEKLVREELERWDSDGGFGKRQTLD